MNTKQMDCVLEIAQTQNFNRAAENLFMSQPALSYQIKQLEEEIGFKIFDRSGRGAALTPAGAQFASSLRGIRADLVRAVELGQNFSSRYRMSISVGLPWRSALMALPECMERMRKAHPDLDISPVFNANESLDAFLSGGQDIALARGKMDHMAQADVYHLYDSRIYLVTKPEDPLAQQDIVHMEDLRGRTLMVGGTSPGPLRAVQNRVLSELGIEHFNSNDHMTTLVSVAAGKGVCLSPGLFNDGTGEFAWTPFDCEETIPVVLLVHAGERREEVLELVRLLCEAYKGKSRWAKLV
ncbi:MAG: LysR family transcriptional regulator [Coriobacteriales bacterium]|jgi:DNA-binding transcriptional LysR family regulator